MDGPLPIKPDPNTNYELENLIKHFLADIGWQEIYSYSLVSEKQALDSGYKLSEHLKLANPLKEENTYLRRSLIPSLIEVIKANPTQTQMSVFELACVYHPRKNDLPAQPLKLTLLSNKTYRETKGDLLNLFDRLFIFSRNQELIIVKKLTKKFKCPLLNKKPIY